MTPDFLAVWLRYAFWGLVYAATACAAILAFAPVGAAPMWVALVVALVAVAHDAHTRFTQDGSGALDG